MPQITVDGQTPDQEAPGQFTTLLTEFVDDLS
jgi:hypothetical protein